MEKEIKKRQRKRERQLLVALLCRDPIYLRQCNHRRSEMRAAAPVALLYLFLSLSWYLRSHQCISFSFSLSLFSSLFVLLASTNPLPPPTSEFGHTDELVPFFLSLYFFSVFFFFVCLFVIFCPPFILHAAPNASRPTKQKHVPRTSR